MRTLEQQINAIESANITATTFKSLKEAADVLTKIQQDITPEKVDQVKYASGLAVWYTCGFSDKFVLGTDLIQQMASMRTSTTSLQVAWTRIRKIWKMSSHN